ncbi:MAG: hypothetical protein KF729_03755 [Sandaracinaceae bacterium]|nr:hypothetical protein [Sandaracinaceae bacterium]
MAGRLARAREWAIRLGVPLAVLAAVLAAFYGELLGIDDEISIVIGQARRGRPLPVRALVLAGIARDEGPELVSLPVELTLRATDGRVLVAAPLAPSPAGGADGVVGIPPDAPDALVLVAVARREGRAVARVTHAISLARAPAAPALVGRLAHSTAHFLEGPLELTVAGPEPSALAARVAGGACVPEARCEVLVHVGAPAALVRFAPSPAITVHETPRAPTDGLTGVVVEVHGPEAHVVLEAVRDGAVVARRALQLPVALATPGLAIEDRARLARDRAPVLSVHALGDRPGLVVDAYDAEGYWIATGSVPRADAPFPAPFALGPGVHRLQVRADPFSAARAASRVVASDDVPLERALAALHALGGDPPDAVPPGPPALRFAWAAAAVEVGHYELPEPVRGYEQDRAAHEARQRTLRLAALVAMGLGIAVLVVALMRRGIDAALEAQRVMDATGDPELQSARHRRRTLLSAATLVGAALCAFVAAAAMVVLRARLLE